jgi:hypothetical protein
MKRQAQRKLEENEDSVFKDNVTFKYADDEEILKKYRHKGNRNFIQRTKVFNWTYKFSCKKGGVHNPRSICKTCHV